MNMISATGLSPAWAAPIATPQTAPSLIGVFLTRSVPNSSAKAAVAIYGPPSATSSPSTITAGSARIALASAELIAWTKVISGINQLRGHLWLRKRTGAGELHRALHLVTGGHLHPGGVIRVEPPAIDRQRLQPHQRVAPAPLFLRDGVPVLLGVALVVAAPAMREALEQHRAAALTRRRQEAGERVLQPRNVAAIDGLAQKPVRRDCVAHPLHRRVRRAWRELRKAVVLAHQDHGESPERGEVDRLDEMPCLHRAVSEEHDGHLVGAGQPGRERVAERERHVPADHPRRPEKSVLHVDE